jgi:hypothetical protein
MQIYQVFIQQSLGMLCVCVLIPTPLFQRWVERGSELWVSVGPCEIIAITQHGCVPLGLEFRELSCDRVARLQQILQT